VLQIRFVKYWTKNKDKLSSLISSEIGITVYGVSLADSVTFIINSINELKYCLKMASWPKKEEIKDFVMKSLVFKIVAMLIPKLRNVIYRLPNYPIIGLEPMDFKTYT
jgi:hypothetical protein